MRISGTLRYIDLEGGTWLLVGDDGRKYQLEAAPEGLAAGSRVEVDGEAQTDRMSFQMAGTPFRVKSARKL